jgi:hypothetical protein
MTAVRDTHNSASSEAVQNGSLMSLRVMKGENFMPITWDFFAVIFFFSN